MPIIVAHFPENNPAAAEAVEFATPYEAAKHLLLECSSTDLQRLAITELRAIKRTVAKVQSHELAEVGGESGGA